MNYPSEKIVYTRSFPVVVYMYIFVSIAIISGDSKPECRINVHLLLQMSECHL